MLWIKESQQMHKRKMKEKLDGEAKKKKNPSSITRKEVNHRGKQKEKDKVGMEG